MADFKEVKIENKIVYAPPMITDDPLVVDKGYTFVNREGKKDYLNAILGYKLEDSAAIFRVETWRNRTALVKLTFHSEAAFRFQMFPFERVPEKLNSVFEFPVYDQVELKEEGDSVVFSTARTRLVIRKNPWEMVVELDGKEITREQIRDFNVDQRYKGIPVGFTVDRWGNVSDCFETMYLHSDEDFYGFGEKFTDFNKRGQKITVWQRDAQSTSADVSYKGMPYFMSTYGYSIAVNTYTRNHFNMGASSAVSYNMEVEDPYLDYYMFCNRDYKELVSDYLKFTKGLVDSDDFPLNISREILQNSPLLKKISSNIENKLIEKLKDLQKNDYDKYLKFVDIYIDNIKYGIYSSYGAKKDLLADLLVYKTNKDEKGITLKKYVEDKKEDQKYIYYATGKTPEEILLKPEMEKYKRDDIQVLLLTSNIDEFCLMMMQNYDKLEFKNISSENKDEITEEEKKRLQTLTDENKRFLDEIKNSLKDKIDEVSFSNKLVDSPLCITSKEGLSLNMEKVLENQPKMDEDSHSPKAIKVLEINPDHKLFKAIKDLDDESLKKYAPILYEEALLLEGYEVEDKKSFVENLNNLLINKK